MSPALPGCCWLPSTAAARRGSAVELGFVLYLWPASRILPISELPSIALHLNLWVWLLPAKIFEIFLDQIISLFCSKGWLFFLQGTVKLEILFTEGQLQVFPWHSPCNSTGQGLVQKKKLHLFIDKKCPINSGKFIWCGEIRLMKSCWSIPLLFLTRLQMEPGQWALAGTLVPTCVWS